MKKARHGKGPLEDRVVRYPGNDESSQKLSNDEFNDMSDEEFRNLADNGKAAGPHSLLS